MRAALLNAPLSGTMPLRRIPPPLLIILVRQVYYKNPLTAEGCTVRQVRRDGGSCVGLNDGWRAY